MVYGIDIKCAMFEVGNPVASWYCLAADTGISSIHRQPPRGIDVEWEVCVRLCVIRAGLNVWNGLQLLWCVMFFDFPTRPFTSCLELTSRGSLWFRISFQYNLSRRQELYLSLNNWLLWSVLLLWQQKFSGYHVQRLHPHVWLYSVLVMASNPWIDFHYPGIPV